MLEMTLIRMAMLQSVLPIDEIIKKLEELEKAHPSEKKEPDGGPPFRESDKAKPSTESEGEGRGTSWQQSDRGRKELC